MGPAQITKTQKMCNLTQMIKSPKFLLFSVGIGRYDPWQAWTSIGNCTFSVALELRFDLIGGALSTSKSMEVKLNWSLSSEGEMMKRKDSLHVQGSFWHYVPRQRWQGWDNGLPELAHLSSQPRRRGTVHRALQDIDQDCEVRSLRALVRPVLGVNED